VGPSDHAAFVRRWIAAGRAGGTRRRALLERARAGETDDGVRAAIEAALDGGQKSANSGRLR
ncbi:MAG: hypothetical protein ACRD6R_02135, partial [Candidatus Polarisedimenticolia bacterium]